MEDVLREPFQRTSCYFNCALSSSRSRFSNQNWWLHSYRSWSGNTKPQELKSAWYWLCHVCRNQLAWWWKATKQASPLGKASSAFWKLELVWKSRASLQQKVQRFIVSALSLLSYGCESWVLTSNFCRQIDSVQTSCIRIILCVSRTDHVSNEEVYDRTGTVSFSQSLKALQVRFLGHCLRHRQGDQIHFENTSNQDLVDVNSISLVCCKANQSCKPPVRQEIRPLAQDRKTWKSMEVDWWHRWKPPLALTWAEKDVAYLTVTLLGYRGGHCFSNSSYCWWSL